MDDAEQTLVRIFNELGWREAAEIAAIVIVAWALTTAVQRGLPWLTERFHRAKRHRILPFVPVLKMVILVGALAITLSIVIRPTVENMVTILGASAIAIGFAFRDYLSGVVAGVVAVFERPHRPGDWVRIGDAYGEVTKEGLRGLEMVTPDDTRVLIPHSKLWDTAIYNANAGSRELMCVVRFFVDPRHDAAAVRSALYDAALTSPYVQLELPITVVLWEEPWGTHYRVKAYPVDARQQFQFISDVTVRGKAALAALGVAPAVPSVSVATAEPLP
ncbi:MAG: mechanosensitive ion channel family protein [Rhodospirillales bacterium]|nr:MAG: mechanosensitive ion channel family protein [Rhodospirillales bacterium]